MRRGCKIDSIFKVFGYYNQSLPLLPPHKPAIAFGSYIYLYIFINNAFGASESPNPPVTSAYVCCQTPGTEAHALWRPFFLMTSTIVPFSGADRPPSGSCASLIPVSSFLPSLSVRQQPAKIPRGHTWSRLMWQSQLLIIARAPTQQLGLDVRVTQLGLKGPPGWITKLTHVLCTDEWAELCSLSCFFH